MSGLSLKALCIEYYTQHIKKPSNEVYLLFKREGLLSLLDEEYEDLHGMGMEYLMAFIDDYLKKRSGFHSTKNKRCEVITHSTVRATILPVIVAKIAKRYHISEDTALDRFYQSATGASFADDETGLYGQSPNYIFGLYMQEIEEQEKG